MATIKWVQNDTAPSISISVKNSDGTAYNLTGCTVRLRIRDTDTDTETNSNSNNTCTITSATGGTVTYAPNSTDLPDVKNYAADLEITTASSKVTTPFEQVIFAVREKN